MTSLAHLAPGGPAGEGPPADDGGPASSASGTPLASDAPDGGSAAAETAAEGRSTLDSVASVAAAHLPVAGAAALPATGSDAAEVMRVTLQDEAPPIVSPRALSEEAAQSELV